MRKRIIIFGNGKLKRKDRYSSILKENDFIICADGGTKIALSLKLKIDLIIGDLDSVPAKLRKKLESDNIALNILPKDKDESDVEAAINYSLNQSPDSIVLLGALGGRIDHMLINVNLLVKPLNSGIPCKIIGDEEEIILINSYFQAEGKEIPGQTVSIIPMTPVVNGISLKGFKYSLSDENLHFGSSRGLSNIITETKAEIKIKNGLLLVIINKKPEISG